MKKWLFTKMTEIPTLRKQATQSSHQNLILSRVWHQRKRRIFAALVHSHPLACAIFSNMLRVGKEIKESTAQRSLDIFLVFCILQPVKKTCFQRKIMKTLCSLPLVLRGQLLLNYFVHSENTISEHMAIFKKNICKFFKYL